MYTTVIDYFEETIKKYPDKLAVIQNDEKITFQELSKKGKYLAGKLLERKVFKNKPISVFLPKGISAVVADIAIMYSGNIFMNLEVKTPIERIKNIINLVDPEVIITTRSVYTDTLKGAISKDVIYVEDIFELFENDKISNNDTGVLNEMIDTDPFCIINTSGSTGTPKGVVLNQRSFFDFMTWSTEQFNLDGTQIIGSLSPIVFDIYVFELCLLIMRGATMVLIDSVAAMLPAKMLDILVKENVNFIFWVPSIMVNIANMNLLEKFDLSKLINVWFAGEVFPTKQFNYWRKHLKQAKFTNLYGPIEITLDCTYYTVEREFEDNEMLPIGYPCKNTDVLILNENNELCAKNEVGELCVRGTSLAMGYYNNSEKTKLAFTQNPLNKAYPETIYRTGDMVYVNASNEIMFSGRKDSLIKHMGYRIELGEIEHIIQNDLNIVKYCCAVYDKEEKKIVLFYESEDSIEESGFRKKMLNVLPKYMIPTIYIRKDELPRNTNGKIDRQKLNDEVNCSAHNLV